MIKTANDIERDFYQFVKNSELGNAIRGEVLRDGMREDNAKSEDLIVKFLAGLDEQVQTGIVLIHIYVPNKTISNRNVRDTARIGELERLVRDFVDTAGGVEYWLETDTTPKSIEVENINQWLVIARIKFKRLT